MKDEVRDLVDAYYHALLCVLAANPHLEGCLKCCKHCDIRFLTDPRNRKRDDLRCPFGCRQAHLKQQRAKSCAQHRATEKGKEKKKALNQRRSKSKSQPISDESIVDAPTGEDGEVSKLNPVMVEHVRMVTSLIEGRQVSRHEVIRMLRRTVRQYRLARERRIDYAVRYLNNQPPDG